ncbi:hypothetical protein DYB26_005820 [Aphanomyces astaci]|uniref:Uncharacterized protein n=1 Tax=Aphanomyces astaci TaxID=112090 RepID=A0A397AMM0_APHAT|nr:hypothetical protein DYB36_003156 [Aphanomyces astaci]RHY73344.1 hypothetical protein DYB38_013019 [Aphanomyces astaci]RHY83602.1 hypothetical protein DYB26_005820 [Aphanomyces astaci]RHZ17364.1 hypothetical protein DYB31_005381 [Aphanomyces astaci]
MHWLTESTSTHTGKVVCFSPKVTLKYRRPIVRIGVLDAETNPYAGFWSGGLPRSFQNASLITVTEAPVSAKANVSDVWMRT